MWKARCLESRLSKASRGRFWPHPLENATDRAIQKQTCDRACVHQSIFVQRIPLGKAVLQARPGEAVSLPRNGRLEVPQTRAFRHKTPVKAFCGNGPNTFGRAARDTNEVAVCS